MQTKIVWRTFWKKFDEWYIGQSWEEQAKELIDMLAEHIGLVRAKRVMKMFNLMTVDVDGGEMLDDWKGQSKLFEDLYALEVKYKQDCRYQ